MRSLNLLIIEDELVTAQDIRLTLEKAGHNVTAIARNLSMALTSARNNPPDLALIDINLEHSEEDGIDVAQSLLAQHTFPILFLTSHSEPAMISRAQLLHPAAYLLKPFRHKELAIHVELAYYNYQATKITSPDPFLADNLYLPVDHGKGYAKIRKSEVLYLMADRAYVEVYLLNEEQKQVFSMSLGYISQFFTADNFYNLSRSILVNLDFVERIDKNQFYVQGRKTPVSFPESNHKSFLKRFAVVRTPGRR